MRQTMPLAEQLRQVIRVLRRPGPVSFASRDECAVVVERALQALTEDL